MAKDTDKPDFYTTSGIEVKPFYGDADMTDQPDPGSFPYTRGIYSDMYRGRLWTMRQYAGFGTAAETNQRFKFLLEQGQTGLSVAFDLPTQMGYDSDHPLAHGEVGKVGVAIPSLAAMEALFDGIPLGKVSTSMTINAPASILLLMYELVGEKQGVSSDQLKGTIQNDILKEYVARGTYIFPPRPSMRLVTDTFEYCQKHVPQWNTISISGYHMREAGATAAQEIAFTLSNAIAYVQAAIGAGLKVDEFAPRLSFFFNANSNFIEEVAKFRAARRMWANIMKDRFGAKNPRSLMLRFHTQTGGATLTSQQPLNNVVRVALQALAAVFGGTQSLHTNSYDEALALPSQEAVTIALRTQQIIAHEAEAGTAADPLGGSYMVEALTDELEKRATELMAEVDKLGGSVPAIEEGYIQAQIHESAYLFAKQVEDQERIVVGVNKYKSGEEAVIPILRLDPTIEKAQVQALEKLRAGRDNDRVAAALAEVKRVAAGDDSLLYPMKEALRVYATLGEICDALREVFGRHRAR